MFRAATLSHNQSGPVRTLDVLFYIPKAKDRTPKRKDIQSPGIVYVPPGRMVRFARFAPAWAIGIQVSFS